MGIADHQKAKLKELFPEVFTEGSKIDFEQLKRTLGEMVDGGKERFGMNWAGKADCFKTIQQPSVATLVPCPEESIDFDTTENVFIEGDNLEVLKLLQKSYLGKIKMIYIDPPYNTGNDFIYPDNYSENLDTYLEYTGQIDGEGRKFSTNVDTDGRFHSKWMNMMYPRLFLAKNLLREDGVIFISIDDAEIHNLLALCNEIYGEENCVGTIIWQHSLQPKGYSGKFSVHHNYILCYKKSEQFNLENLDRTDEHNKNYANPDNDPRGLWRTGDVRNALYRPNLIYKITTPSGKTINPPENGWRWSKETLESKISTGEIVFSKDEARIIRKIYLDTLDGRTPETIIFGKEVGTTRDAASEIKDIFDGSTPFDTPKPTTLINHLCGLAGLKSGDTVMDFFAGSGTTGHAVMTQNSVSESRVQYVLVQLPEPLDPSSKEQKAAADYCDKIGKPRTIAELTKERLRRAGKKIDDTQTADPADLFLKPDASKNKLDNGFRVFKLRKSNFKVWDATLEKDAAHIQLALEAHIDHIDPNASQKAILFELLLKAGFELTTPLDTLTLANKTVFRIAEGALLICLEKELTLDLIKAIADLEPSRVIVLDEGFQNNDQLKTNASLTLKAKGIVDFRTV